MYRDIHIHPLEKSNFDTHTVSRDRHKIQHQEDHRLVHSIPFVRHLELFPTRCHDVYS